MHISPHLEPAKPPLALRRADQQALLAIAYGGLLSDTRGAGALLYEASRAQLAADDDLSLRTVTLWSNVSFRDENTRSHHVIRLVPPKDAHGPSASVSVLSPLGAALIGLSRGQHIRCPDRRGGELNLTVLDVSTPTPQA